MINFTDIIYSSFFEFVSIFHYIFLAVFLSAWAMSIGIDSFLGKFVNQYILLSIVGITLIATLTPLCSLLVVTFIVALLRTGASLGPAMSLWIASPIIDPSSFIFTVAMTDMKFAFYRLLAAIFIGVASGLVAHFFYQKLIVFQTPLKQNVSIKSCGTCNEGGDTGKINFFFFKDKDKRRRFYKSIIKDLWFFSKVIFAVFIVIGFVKTAISPEAIAHIFEGKQGRTVLFSALLGTPLYLNGVAAMTIIAELINQGMSRAAAITFIISGATTSIPAMMAVFPFVRFPVFLLYIMCSFIGSITIGYIFYFGGWI